MTAERPPFQRGEKVQVMDWSGPFPGRTGTVMSTDYADSIEVGFIFDGTGRFAPRTVLYRADELERVEEKL